MVLSGASIAFALMQRGLFSEINLLDVEQCGQSRFAVPWYLSDGLPYSRIHGIFTPEPKHETM